MEITVIVIIGTLILIGLVSYYLVKKLKQDAWEGELVDKREETSSSGDYDTTNYVLVVKLADGTTKRTMVSKKLYNQLVVGERLIKEQGKTYPSKKV